MSETATTPPRPAGGRWTTRALLQWMREAFERRGVDQPRHCAELLLAHVLGCDRLRLYMDVDRPATEAERRRLRELAARALRHEPVQYLVGQAWFYSLPFAVDRRVLIPRPSSETVVELVLHHARTQPGHERSRIGDVCTGSGAIAIALLKNLAEARCVATDISRDALDAARANAERHGVAERLELRAGDLLEPLRDQGRSLHYLVANPPYIPDHEWDAVPPNVKDHEPEGALRGGLDGMRFVAPLLREGATLLRPGGLMLVEIAESTSKQALALAKDQPGLRDARIEDDAEGRPRVLVAAARG